MTPDTPERLGFETEWEAMPLAPTVEDNVTDLKPCPFCGGNQIQSGHVRDGRCIGCTSCGSVVRAFHPNAEANAREKWNTRVPTLADALAVPEVAALVALVRAIAATEWQETEPAAGWIPDGCEAYVAEMEQHCNWSVEQARAALAAMEGW